MSLVIVFTILILFVNASSLLRFSFRSSMYNNLFSFQFHKLGTHFYICLIYESKE